ncbi:MAG: HAMP domain-containing histidine kinase, partial [Alphaproteobacteria bacterium]|nr:HAMP domain-containing histidine kinase [Alphaproteobacteria bacterium]
AAAHELGTPLGTIALVARELRHEVPAESPLRADIDLLGEQAARCREILSGLARRPEGVDPFARQSLPQLIESAAAPHRKREIGFRLAPAGEGPAPLPAHAPEIVHGLSNLIQNAFDFARSEVAVEVGWGEAECRVAIRDDGPGIPYDVLSAIGEPYLSTKNEGEGMGLGLFIAQTLLERTGAAIAFGNRRAAGGAVVGAEVVVTWPRQEFEAGAAAP